MRIRYEKLGGHYHCRVFTAGGPGQTFAKCGELVFDERDWAAILNEDLLGIAELVRDSEE